MKECMGDDSGARMSAKNSSRMNYSSHYGYTSDRFLFRRGQRRAPVMLTSFHQHAPVIWECSLLLSTSLRFLANATALRMNGLRDAARAAEVITL